MSHLIAYRIGSLQNPHLPFAQVAEMGIQGLELVWTEETTVDQVAAALSPHGLRVTSLHAQCPLEDDALPAVLGQRAAQAADLGATYLFVSAHAGEMPKQEAYERLRRLGDAVGPHQVYLAMKPIPICARTRPICWRPWLASVTPGLGLTMIPPMCCTIPRE